MPSGYTIALYRPRLGPTAQRVFQYRFKREVRGKAVAGIARALQRGDYELMMKVVGEAKFLPNHMLRFRDHFVAIETLSGLAWCTDSTGGQAIGSIFSLLGYADLEDRFADPQAQVGIAMTLPEGANTDAVSHAIAQASGIRIDAPTVEMSLNRAAMVALMLAVLDGLDRDPENAPQPHEYCIRITDPVVAGEPAR